MVKLNSDGTLVHRFENFNLWNSDNTNRAIVNKIIIDENSLIVTGKFTNVNANLQRSIVRIDFDGNLINNFNSPILATTHTYNYALITDIIRHNDKYYYSTISNTPNSTSWTASINIYDDCDINILRTNLDGTLDTSFSPITIDRSNQVSYTNAYSQNYPYTSFSPRNVYFNFNDTNKMVIFGQYNSINNEPYIGLSRIIIDENLSTPSNQFSADNIKCYPNPTHDIINITTQNENITQINVYDMFGRLLKSQKGNTNCEKATIQELPNAMYLVEVKTEQTTKTIKISKE